MITALNPVTAYALTLHAADRSHKARSARVVYGTARATAPAPLGPHRRLEAPANVTAPSPARQTTASPALDLYL